MKIAATATGPGLNSSVDPRFGRCAYFIIIDPQTMEYRSIENPNISLGGGAGIQSAQLIAQQEVHSVLTGNCGPNAFQTLSAAGVQVLTGVRGSIRQAVDQFKMGAHTNATGPNVVDHFGVGGGSRDTGRGMGGGMCRGTGRGIGIGMSADSFPGEIGEGQNDTQSIDLLKNQIEILEGQLADLRKRIRGKGERRRKSPLIARIIPDRCTGCRVCVKVCPTSAISIVESVARIEAAACRGCGQCIEACPQGAIVLETA